MVWILKTEPETYSISDLEKEKIGVWDGVRNYQARNYLRQMQLDDKVLIYHSHACEFVGTAKVVKTAYLDPKDEKWVNVNIQFIDKFSPVSLKTAQVWSYDFPFFKQSRLSVSPAPLEFYLKVIQHSKLNNK